MHLAITFEESDFVSLRAHLLQDPQSEEAAYLICGVSETEGECRWLVREIRPVPREGFVRKESYGLTVSAVFTDSILQECRNSGSAVVLVHSHPFDYGSTRYSSTDDRGEADLFEVFYKRVSGIPHASLLFGGDCVIGRHWKRDGSHVELDEVRVLGSTIKVFQRGSSGKLEAPPEYDRQVLAFGEQGQRRVMGTKVGIVGLGGTGSITAEQIVRLGVQHVVLIDGDRLEHSNVSRVFASTAMDAELKGFKVEVVRAWLRKISPAIQIDAYVGSVLRPEIGKALREVDVIFGCTDNHSSRAIVNQIAYQYLIPYIDMGSRVAAGGPGGAIGSGRVVVMTPGAPCLWCYEDIRARRITEEMLPSEDREKLAAEGYVEGLEVVAPAVVSLNVTVSGIAVTEFLDLVAGFRTRSESGRKLHYRLATQSLETVVVEPLLPCVCSRNGRYWGFGDQRPFPGTH